MKPFEIVWSKNCDMADRTIHLKYAELPDFHF
jgi:hypothetical protein